MPALQTKLNPRGADFKASADAMRLLVADLNAEGAQRMATELNAAGGRARRSD